MNDKNTSHRINIETIGRIVADTRPDMNYMLNDEFIEHAATQIVAMLLTGMDSDKAIYVGFTAAALDFGYIDNQGNYIQKEDKS